MPLALDLKGIDASYGQVQALFSLELPVPEGKVTAVLGPNGAGKTTTLKAIAGLVPPDRGQVLMRGENVAGLAPRRIARKGLCLIPEGRGVFPSLTVRENLLLQCGIAHKPLDAVEATAYQRFPVLGSRRNQIAATLSGGEQQMLALSRALTTDPDVILIDEISMGLAPIIVERLFESVVELAREGRTIVLVEQLAELVMEVADFVAVMSKGSVAHIGQPEDVRDLLEEIYLGGEGREGTQERVTDDTGTWRTPSGTLAHRGACPVVIGRTDVKLVADISDLQDCSICRDLAVAGIAG